MNDDISLYHYKDWLRERHTALRESLTQLLQIDVSGPLAAEYDNTSAEKGLGFEAQNNGAYFPLFSDQLHFVTAARRNIQCMRFVLTCNDQSRGTVYI